MASLGSFGAAVRELDPDGERDTFDFFGETFTVEGVIPGVLALKICAGMAGVIGGIEQDAAVFEALRHALTKPGDKPDEASWDRFYDLAVARKCHSQELVNLVINILGAQAGRPTEQRSTSEDGSLPTTKSSSTSASDSPDSPRLVPVEQILAG